MTAEEFLLPNEVGKLLYTLLQLPGEGGWDCVLTILWVVINQLQDQSFYIYVVRTTQYHE